MVRWFHQSFCHQNMFLVYKRSRQLKLLFLKKVFYVTEVICLITSNKNHHLSPHLCILLIQGHQGGVCSDLLYANGA